MKTIERIETLTEFRCGTLTLVGQPVKAIDPPEVEMVAIMDADKEGFLRSETSLIQTIGAGATCTDASFWRRQYDRLDGACDRRTTAPGDSNRL